MAINIEKRTRAISSDPWGAWAVTTDIPPYTDTELVQYRVQGTVTLDVTDLTTNVQVDETDPDNVTVTGDGVFDDIMETMTKHIIAQHDSGRITGPDFATVYLGGMQVALQEAVKFLLQSNTTEKNLAVLAAQEELYKRQKAGFDDNKHQKILEAQFNAWGITFQDTDTTYVPNQINQTEFNTTMAAVRKDYTE